MPRSSLSRLGCCMLCLFLLVGGLTNRGVAFSCCRTIHPRPSNIPLLAASRKLSCLNMSSSEDATAASPASPDVPINLQEGDIMFGKFVIPSACVFYRSESSYAFVNLRPLVPGHVLVIPHIRQPYLADLTDQVYTDLWMTVRRVQIVLQQQYPKTTAFNVAVQDGRAAGQSVPHAVSQVFPCMLLSSQKYDASASLTLV